MENRLFIIQASPRTYDLIDSWRAVVNRARIYNKGDGIKCSSVPGNPFRAIKSLELTKKMKE
jgi:hypothetical protein